MRCVHTLLEPHQVCSKMLQGLPIATDMQRIPLVGLGRLLGNHVLFHGYYRSVVLLYS